ncbi:MAG: hypothetical protein C4K60_16520 [Ideonella sp. MAG2]|nr:MAG: hypothetical protein C4K60_16520 [Ideonella sp. MAG2]
MALTNQRSMALQSDGGTLPLFVSKALPSAGEKGAWTMAYGPGKVMGWRESNGVVRVLLLEQGQINELPDILWDGKVQPIDAQDCLRVNLQGRVACTFGEHQGVALWRPDLQAWTIIAAPSTSDTKFRVIGLNERNEVLIERLASSSDALLVSEEGHVLLSQAGKPLALNEAGDMALHRQSGSQETGDGLLDLIVTDRTGKTHYTYSMAKSDCHSLSCYRDWGFGTDEGFNAMPLNLTPDQRFVAIGYHAQYDDQKILRSRPVFVEAGAADGQVWEAGLAVSDTEQLMDINANVARRAWNDAAGDSSTLNPYAVANQRGDAMLLVTLADYAGAMTRSVPVLYLDGGFYDARTLLANPAAAPGVAFGRSINALRQMVECAEMQTNDQCWLIEPASLASAAQ